MNHHIRKDFKIETKRLILSQPTLEDLPAVFSASRVKGFNNGMVWDPPEKEEDLKEFFYTSLKAWEDGTSYSFTISLKDSGEFCGRISIRKDVKEGEWNIGFWTHPRQQRKGIMTEAGKAIIDFGFLELGAIRIEAGHALWNLGSRKVMENLGMKFVRRQKEGFQKNGVWVEEDFMEITREDWKSH